MTATYSTSFIEPNLFNVHIFFLQDLEFLSSGLEGRSSSPVAVLFDTLTHPYADMGQQAASLLEWRNDGQGFDHVVLGKNAEGGVWQVIFQ